MTDTHRSKRSAKDAAAIPPDASASRQPSRRSFLGRLWLGIGLVALAETTWVLVSFLRPRRDRSAPTGQVVIAGALEDFAPGTVTAFPGGKLYLVRLDDGGFLAISRRCTHLGCTVPWDEASARFVCPCHASTFDLRGDVMSPPAPRALDLFPIRIENGIIKVDVSGPVRRSLFDPAQVARA